MKIVFLFTGFLAPLIEAIRTCWKSHEKSDSSYNEAGEFVLGQSDKRLVRLVSEKGHTSTLEHLSYTIKILGISRALLQELVRHRIASFSVESSRYCLKKLLEHSKVSDTVVSSGNTKVDLLVLETMEKLKKLMQEDPSIPNDQLKYAIPEAFKTNLVTTINARSLQNMFRLRSSKRALPEFQKLVGEINAGLPEDHKFIFEGCIENEN